MGLSNYSYEEPKSRVFDAPDGDHDARIKHAELRKAKSGSMMVVFVIEIKDSNGVDCTHFLTDGEYFNSNLSRITDCFGTPNGLAGNLQVFNWDNFKGRTGSVHIEHRDEQWTDEQGVTRNASRARIKFFNAKNAVQNKQIPEEVQKLANAVNGTIINEDIPF